MPNTSWNSDGVVDTQEEGELLLFKIFQPSEILVSVDVT